MAAGGLLAIAFGLPSLLGPRVPAVRVERQALVVKVVSTGRVEPPARANLGTVVLGTVLRVHVQEGDRVHAGQVLVELDRSTAEADVSQAEAALDAATARLEQLRRVAGRQSDEALRQAEIRLAQAERDLERIQSLAKAGAATQLDLDQAVRAEALARSQRESAQALASATGPGGAELRATTALRRQSEAALAGARARLNQLRLVAPADGTVLRRDVEPGDVVQPGRALIVLALDGPTYLEVQPDEKSLALLRVGLRARASADAFPSESFEAEVDRIAPAVDPLRGTVEVKLRVPEPPAYLRADMTVSVDIEAVRKVDALVLPPEAVRGLESAAPYVLAVDGNRTRRRTVKIGHRGEGALEVVEGLGAGDVVLLPGPKQADGMRVRPALGVR